MHVYCTMLSALSKMCCFFRSGDMDFSVAPEPRLGLAWIWLKVSVKKLDLCNFSKSLYLKNFANTSFLKNFEKDHWQNSILMGNLQVFLSTMSPEGHFQPKDWSKICKICQKWPKSSLYYVFFTVCKKYLPYSRYCKTLLNRSPS